MIINLIHHGILLVKGSQHLYSSKSLKKTEFPLIYQNARVDEFKGKLSWNNLYCHPTDGL